MGLGGGGEQYDISIRSVYTDQATAGLAQAQRAVDAYTASLEKMVAAQARAGLGGAVQVNGATVAQSSASPSGGRIPGLPEMPAVQAGPGGPGRQPVVGGVTVGSFSAASGSLPARAPSVAQAGGLGGPGRSPGVVSGTSGGAGVRPPGGGQQNLALRVAVTGLRDVEAVSGALSGIVASVTSLRSITLGAGLGALLSLPMGAADQIERAARALSAVTGSAQAGAQMSQQLESTLASQPFDMAQQRSAAVSMARVSAGQFAAQTPSEVAAITGAGAALGLSDSGVQQIEATFQSAQSLTSRRRMTGQQVLQLEDVTGLDLVGQLAAARQKAHPGEAISANEQALRNALLYGGYSLPGAETTAELTQILQQYADQHPEARQSPDVQRAIAGNRARQATAQIGQAEQGALAPFLAAASQGDVGGALAGLAPWTLAQGNLGAGLAIGAGEFMVGTSMLDTMLRGPFRAMRPVMRAGRALGVLPRGGRTPGVTPGVDPLTERAAAVGLSRDELGQIARQMGGTPEQVLPILERGRGVTRVAPEAAAAGANEPVAGALSRVRAPGRPPVPPTGGGAAIGAEEATAREVGVLGRVGGGLGRVGGALGRAAPWLGLGLGLLGAYEAAQQGQQEDAARQAGGAAGGFAGGWGGAVAGAAIGTAILPGVGTVAGGLIGGLGGGLAGGWLGEQAGGAFGGMLGLHDQQTTNEHVLQTTQNQVQSAGELDRQTVQLGRDFGDLDQITRTLTVDFRALHIAVRSTGGSSSGGGTPPSPPPGGAPGALNVTPPAGVISPVPGGPGAVVPTSGGGWGAPDEMRAYIAQEAARRGIDAATATGVFSAESGGFTSFVGDQGSSFGPTQLHLGGLAPGGNSGPGLGDTFKQETGLDPRDPSTWRQQIQFSLDQAAAGHSWGPWHASAAVGIAPGQGLSGAHPVGVDATPSAPPVSPDVQTGGGNTVVSVNMGGVTVPTTVGAPPQDAAGLKTWAQNAADYLLEEMAGRLSNSNQAAPASTITPAAVAFGG